MNWLPITTWSELGYFSSLGFSAKKLSEGLGSSV